MRKVRLGIIILAAITLAACTKAVPGPIIIKTETVTASVAPSPVVAPVTEQPIDLALADIHAGVFVGRFCHIMDGPVGLEMSLRIFQRIIGRPASSGTIARVWQDASAQYGLSLTDLGRAFYYKFC